MIFNVGDKVKVISEYGRVPLNSIGKIINIYTEEPNALIGVEFDFHVNGHDCNGRGKHGHCWNIRKNSLELIDEFKEGTIIKWYKNGELK